MADTRTVYDVLHGSELFDDLDTCAVLGIDPDTPFEDFARWLRYGKKADEMGRFVTPPHPTASVKWFGNGWNNCLAIIKDTP